MAAQANIHRVHRASTQDLSYRTRSEPRPLGRANTRSALAVMAWRAGITVDHNVMQKYQEHPSSLRPAPSRNALRQLREFIARQYTHTNKTSISRPLFADLRRKRYGRTRFDAQCKRSGVWTGALLSR